MSSKAIQRFVKIKADSQGNPPTRIHLMSVGHWHAPWHGNFEMTPQDLEEMVANFDNGVGMVEGSQKLPVNYGHDMGGKAAGWITKLTVENNSTELWGDVTWTEEGERALRADEYRYISPEWNPRSFPYQDPEDEDNWLDNVFTGAALTNIPLFKKLKPIMASLVAPKVKQASVVSDTSSNSKGEPMALELAEVRAKEADKLTAEEKTFLEEHKADLTADELTTFGLEDAGSDDDAADDAAGDGSDVADDAAGDDSDAGDGSGGVQGSAKPVTITAAQLAKLEADAKAGLEASQKLAHKEASDFVAAAVKDGRIKTGDSKGWTEMLLASKGTERKRLETLIDGLPVNASLGQEIGDNGKVEGSAETELSTRAAKLVADSKDKLSYSAAVKQLINTDKDLRERVDAERKETNQK